MKRLLLLSLGIICLCTQFVYADNIKQIVGDNNTVIFTDIPPNYKQVATTQPSDNPNLDLYKGLSEQDAGEIEKAVAQGLVPDRMTFRGDVTASELFALLTNCIQKRMGTTTPKWQAYAKNTSGDAVRRSDAALALYYAAQAMGFDKPNGNGGEVTDSDTIEWESRLFSDWEGEIPVKDGDNVWNYPKLLYAQLFVCCHQNVHTGDKLMDVDAEGRFNYTKNMTKVDTIKAAYRLYMSIEDKPEYVPLSQAGQNTIPLELLNKESSLPEVSNQKIPAYQGYYIQNKESAIWFPGFLANRYFQETDVRFLSENGFNFEKVHLGFSSFSYPDFPDGMVNLNELRDLDQLIAWGIEYNVHICLTMSGLPGVSSKDIKDLLSNGNPEGLYVDAHDKFEDPNKIFDSVDKQKLVLEYWKMLAKRYANVPIKFLSFSLTVEPGVSSDEQYAKVFEPIVDAIWKENPSRVIFSYAYSGDIALETLAKKGCALTWSSYYPSIINYYGASGIELSERYPYLPTPKWPMLYLPATFNGYSDKHNTLVIQGSFDEGSVGIFADKEYMDHSPNSNTVLTILADNKEVLSERVTGKGPEEYVATIPKGTKAITIKVNNEGWLQYGRIQIKQKGKENIDMYPHDLSFNDFNAVMPVLIVGSDGTVTTTDKNLAVDFDYIYNFDIRKNYELAQKYHVGFMVVEWGPFGEISEDSMLGYEEMMLKGFSEHEIGWCHHSLVDKDSILLTKNSYWENRNNGDTEEWKYALLEYDNKFYVNIKLLNLYRKYTMK